MKGLQEKIAKEIKESVKMRDLAIGMPYKQAAPLREEQDRKYNKIQFLKGLNDALRKKESDKDE